MSLITFGINLASSGIITLPLVGLNNVVINWGDGNQTTENTTNPSHTYNNTGSYTISIISGAFSQLSTQSISGGNLFFSSLSSFAYNIKINALTSFSNAFFNVSTNFTITFANNVTNNVTDMSSMFNNATAFNQTISNLDTSNVTTMYQMFRYTSAFNNGDLLNQSNIPLVLNTSNVSNFGGMFSYSSFNQDISSFNTSNATSLAAMFYSATAFNQPLNTFNTSSVRDLSYVFFASPFNQDISSFLIPNVTSTYQIFTNAYYLSASNYNKLLIGWSNQAPNIQHNTRGNLQMAYPGSYTSVSALSAINNLTNNYGWGIDYSRNGIPSPTITSINPSAGLISGGTNVTIVGTNFYNSVYNNPVNLTVNFGVNNATVNSISSDGTSINVTSPSVNSYASVHVTVTTYSGSITSETSFNFVCFLKGSKILTNNGYIPIENLKKGDFVKTLLHGFLPIHAIGKRDIYHSASEQRIKDQLYKCSKDKFNELSEDLVLTGCHSILVDNFISQEQKDTVFEILKDIYITDNKYRVPACVDHRTSVYETPGTYTIYHLALENDDYFMNYGIFANGLLVETCSKRYLKELSNMELIE